MSKPFVDAVGAMASAVTSLRLYGDAHPSARLHADRAAALVNSAMRPGTVQRIVVMPDAIAIGNHPIPQTREQAARLAPLRDAGVDCILVARGVRGDEILTLARCILSKTRPEKSAHINYASLHVASADTNVLSAMCAIANQRSNRARIEDTWQRLQRGEGADDKLWSAIGDITASASSSAGSLIPMAALKHHDEYTFVHTINVGIVSTALARAAGVSGQLLADITAAALLHDVGKRLVPLDILNSPDKLSKPQLAVVQRHPGNGAELLIGAPEVPDLAAVVAYEHHMDIDGGGYPKRHRNWKISLASQIVHIADVFDALRTDRPYRKAMALEQALGIMEITAGRAFDAELFEVFCTRVAGHVEAHKPPEELNERDEPDRQGRQGRRKAA